MIVKIKRALSSSIVNPPVLIYNEDRTFEVFVPSDRMIRFVLAGRDKAYVEARILGNGGIDILHLVDAQPW